MYIIEFKSTLTTQSKREDGYLVAGIGTICKVAKIIHATTTIGGVTPLRDTASILFPSR